MPLWVIMVGSLSAATFYANTIFDNHDYFINAYWILF